MDKGVVACYTETYDVWDTKRLMQRFLEAPKLLGTILCEGIMRSLDI